MDRSGKRYPPLAEGDAFGEISVATGKAVTANIRAETQVVCLRLPTDVVRLRVLTHPNVRHVPDDGDLIDLLSRFAPDDATRERILVTNPEQLYDFA